MDGFLENPAAVLVAFELIEAGAGRRKQHRVAWPSGPAGLVDGRRERSALQDRHGVVT
jgi:hypothetical protein